jgi:hypothetical protein
MSFALPRILALLAAAVFAAPGGWCVCAAHASEPSTPACHAKEVCEDGSRSCCPRAVGVSAAEKSDEPSPPCSCEHCKTSLASSLPDAKSVAPAPLVTLSFVAEALPLETLPLPPTERVFRTTESPPGRGERSLFALHCSLLT